MRYYIVLAKRPQWKHLPYDSFYVCKTKEEAIQKRTNLQDQGFIQTCIKLKKGKTSISDY